MDSLSLTVLILVFIFVILETFHLAFCNGFFFCSAVLNVFFFMQQIFIQIKISSKHEVKSSVQIEFAFYLQGCLIMK